MSDVGKVLLAAVVLLAGYVLQALPLIVMVGVWTYVILEFA